MVCPRCISTVEDICEKLNLEISEIQLGELKTKNEISELDKKALGEALVNNGFELLEDNKSKLIDRIKSTVIDQVHHQSENIKINFSSFLADKLNHEYTSLSKLFSSVEGITIERYILKQKIGKVKELLFYNQLSLSEIAFEMDYSSVAHLSAQFKKETGMSPTEFKKLKGPNYQQLDSL